jgi:DNA-binding LacI/PurR family transcriptional regulator
MAGTPTILYLDTIPGDPIQALTLAGIRRYAAALGWETVAVPEAESRPPKLKALLLAHTPVAGCIVECADFHDDLPPRLFGKTPVVYLHTPSSRYGGAGARIRWDGEAIARTAFRELSSGRPPSFAVAGTNGIFEWSLERMKAFAALAAKAGAKCLVFEPRPETEENRRKRLVEWVAGLPLHTAVFATNDFVARDVATAARAARLSIPHDLTVLGVDNNAAVCETSNPAISSIQLDFERAGFLAARLIGDVFAIKDTKDHKDLVNSVPFLARNATIGPLLAVRRRSTGGSGRREKFVLEAVEMIRREACDGLTAMALAKRFPCSRRLFNMRFREATGHSVLDEIQHVRLERVFALLSGTDTEIGAIADFCGFGSGVELRHVFRARTGKSLREWRKENKHG